MVSHSRNLPNDAGKILLYHRWLELTSLSFTIIKATGQVDVLLILQLHRNSQYKKKFQPSNRAICALLGLLSCWVVITTRKRREACA